jgi:RNA polymerase sigma factor (sigma-70 family)
VVNVRRMAIAGKFEDPYATRRSLLSRVKNPEDQESWRVFYNTYNKMVHSVAAKAGLNYVECEEVVQETFIALSKKMPGFQYDPKKSFRAWLSHTTGFKIKDQFRRRKRDLFIDPPTNTERRTSTIERIADPASIEVEGIFESEWRERVLELAVERVKKQVTATQFQIFELYVMKKWPARKVATTLRISIGRVYLAKHRVWKLVKREVKALESGSI